MTTRSRVAIFLLFSAIVTLTQRNFVYSQSATTISATSKQNARVMNHATGTFEVKLTPQEDKSADASVGRLLIEKQWHGDLEGSSNGEMLTATTSLKDSAGYVAIEKVVGTLNGRSGSFLFQHNGIMNRGEGQLTITVVPDSGTGQLSGIVGKLTIKIEKGKHFYDFEYELK